MKSAIYSACNHFSQLTVGKLINNCAYLLNFRRKTHDEFSQTYTASESAVLYEQ